MANPIIKIKRGTTVPSTGALQAGEFAIDQVAKNLYLGIDDGNGNITNEVVGGEGTFATKAYVANAVTTATGNLGTMSTQNADSVAITGGAIDGTAIGATIPSTGKFTAIESTEASATNRFFGQTQFLGELSGMFGGPLYVASTLDLSVGAGKIEGLTVDPTNDNDAARKKYVDDKVSALGSVFHFVGDVSSATGNDLTTLSDTTTGSYYRVDVAGTYTAGADSFALKVGDAIVKTSTGWQKLDNVDAEVLGTANEISVSGDENVGYTVAIDPVFSGRMTTAEGDITALEGRATDLETKTRNISLTGTTAGVTDFNNTDLINVGAVYSSNILHLEGVNVAEVIATNILLQGQVAVTGATNLNGNTAITGDLSVSGSITDAVIDGGSY